LPEAPLLPLLPLVAVPLALASPVSPEDVSPEYAVAEFDELDVASPVSPPLTVPVVFELPELPLVPGPWPSTSPVSPVPPPKRLYALE
jgi:hypothetical protein